MTTRRLPIRRPTYIHYTSPSLKYRFIGFMPYLYLTTYKGRPTSIHVGPFEWNRWKWESR